MSWKEIFHVDPVTILCIIAGFIAMGSRLKNDSKWHSAWIKKHDAECAEFKKGQVGLLARLTMLAEGHEKRLDRLERHEDMNVESHS